MVKAEVVPDETINTEEQVEAVHDAFALTFMDPTARRKQKRYMTAGSMSKPQGWSSRQCASRLSTLNRYLQYLPGTAAPFNEEELKDILVDLHNPVFVELMAQANYNVDEHSYLQLTSYLQNLSLLEESFSKQPNKHHQQDAKAPHKGKKTYTKSKLGKAQCRKHPHHEHTWEECHANPKNKGKAKPKVNFKKTAQAKPAAMNMDAKIDTDSDAELDMD